jgi:hypothetical protein
VFVVVPGWHLARGKDGAISMPFSKYVVDPAHTETMRSAFQKVRDALKLQCDPDDPLTELVAMKIIELAKAGEVDPGRLCGRVLLELTRRPESAGN